uniref:Methyltransferase FkbM domain-containing protein n=1 Tax=Chlamydomonas leiostraca TaxID=1034604 RepID=A0A7S0R318_9CHLO|mmetsp:Transcript_12500/g.30698  ORF Transcript_12500/g.30698 Transcript_12500/m.30698 type:complete len:386 (+) Transcript_12500:185-1342(+)|eukprot:CAMPEP_0202864450 /NCGR_PEP_ID=MMETSP1391-20130828/4685_1 /ASSEMBLY_ACC=CAM_ASM_000867 /TAXON_ID=1034604 /ORGANISM="Chlamydomonas leiostraca, Strain SAG 11-49" /LENGTH=385 /DNA_ID=CAMNT_0049544189 /DNA_START=144 /DNA_END=1301 /DNA_ORIENTATION=+
MLGASISNAKPIQTSNRRLKYHTTTRGLNLAYYNVDELRLLHSECIDSASYLRHGVKLKAGDTCIDVGGNIGLFALTASELVGSSGRVVCLEPLPSAHQAAAENIASHALWARAHGVQACTPTLLQAAAGAAVRPEGIQMTEYEQALGWSTVAPDDNEVAANMRRYLRHLLGPEGEEAEGQSGLGLQASALVRAGRGLQRALPATAPLVQWVAGWVVRGMLAAATTHTVPLTTVSSVIEEQQLTRVDLLKVDVERAELDVLRGIELRHWPLIRQVAVEVHDVQEEEQQQQGEGKMQHSHPHQASASSTPSSASSTSPSPPSPAVEAGNGVAVQPVTQGNAQRQGVRGRVQVVRELLAQQGLVRVRVEQEGAMQGTNLYMVWAARE